MANLLFPFYIIFQRYRERDRADGRGRECVGQMSSRPYLKHPCGLSMWVGSGGVCMCMWICQERRKERVSGFIMYWKLEMRKKKQQPPITSVPIFRTLVECWITIIPLVDFYNNNLLQIHITLFIFSFLSVVDFHISNIKNKK